MYFILTHGIKSLIFLATVYCPEHALGLGNLEEEPRFLDSFFLLD